jgi:tetratricopeptide (TPR) repeat protein
VAEPTPVAEVLTVRSIPPASLIDEAAAEFEPEPSVRVVEREAIEAAAPAAVTPIAETPVEETAVAEVASPEVQSTPVGSMDWWTQVATDEDEAPLTELPPLVKIASAAGAPAARTPAARPSREREPLRRPERLERPIRDLRSRAQREREAKPTPPPAPTPAPAVSVNVDPLVAQLAADKYNHTVRLELARAWWSMGNRESALAEYAKLINPAALEDLSPEELAEREELDFADAGPLADDIIVDLERIVEIEDQPDWLRLLGDMHMKVGNLARALEMYRRALNQL